MEPYAIVILLFSPAAALLAVAPVNLDAVLATVVAAPPIEQQVAHRPLQ